MLYTFGDDYTLDPTGYELRQHGRRVRLEPRVFDLLAYLVQHPDRTVTKEELLAQLWPQQFVTDASLTYCVAQARKALGETGQTPRYIQTVRRRGYRFISPVDLQQQPEAVTGGPLPAATRLPVVQQPVGVPLSRTPTVVESPALVVASGGAWEHKLVAVLAIELTWPGSAEPEAVGAAPWRASAAWQHTIVEQVQAFGGGVLQRSPSLLLVTFGTPQTLDQLPQRVVQAALALRQLAVEPTNGGPCPEVRVVGHWGPLLVEVQAPDPTVHVQALGETLAWPVRLLRQVAPG